MRTEEEIRAKLAELAKLFTIACTNEHERIENGAAQESLRWVLNEQDELQFP